MTKIHTNSLSPFVSFDSINHNGSRLLNLLSFMEFNHDLKANKLPQYAHLSPDMRHNGHDTGLDYGAKWANSFLGPLLNDETFTKDTLVLLTYDESETSGKPNKIISLLLGGAVPENKRGTVDNTFYTHYSILSTLENNWSLPNLGRYDVGANVFKLVADRTGHKNHAVNPEAEKIDLSVSYPGFLNNITSEWREIPPPNLKLVGAGGEGVDMGVRGKWKDAHLKESPYAGSWKVFDAKNLPAYKPQEPNFPAVEG
jgi:acid phosphatase